MKIIQLIQRPQLRGAETFAAQLAVAHHHAGHEVLLVALFDNPASEQLCPPGLPISCLSFSPSKRLFDPKAWSTLARLIREFNPDIVQANAGDTLKYAVFSRLLYGWPGRLVFRNANNLSSFIRSRGQKFFLRSLLRRVDSVVSVSENCREDFVAQFPRLSPITTTITIGTAVDVAPERQRTDVLSEFAIPTDEPVIVNVGSFVPEKNHHGLLRIFAEVRKQLGKGHLLLVGDGKLRAALEQQCDELGLRGLVHFAGYRKDVGELLFHTDLMLMPSLIEGLPGVILEAMARRVPVVASAVGGIGEVIKHGRTGYLIAATDEQRFATVTADALGKGGSNMSVASRAVEIVRDRLAIDRIAQEFLVFYQKLALSDSRSPHYKIARPGWRGNAAARNAARPQPGPI